jgi:hypothetical protein
MLLEEIFTGDRGCADVFVIPRAEVSLSRYFAWGSGFENFALKDAGPLPSTSPSVNSLAPRRGAGEQFQIPSRSSIVIDDLVADGAILAITSRDPVKGKS